MFNDDAGFELVNLQAQRDLNSLVKNDKRRHVNRDRTTTIDKDERVTVHGQRVEVVDKDEHITIHQNRTEVVDKDETITIHQNRQERVDENETLDIGGNRTETVHKSEQILIKGNRDKTVKGNDTLTVNKNRKEIINKSRSLTVDKNNTELVKMAKSVTVGIAYATQVGTVMNTAVGIMQSEQIGAIKKTLVGKSYSISVGDKFEISVGSSKITMTEDSISITAKTILVAAEKENVLIGKDVLINPPGGGGASPIINNSSNQTIKPASGAGKPYIPPTPLQVLKSGDTYPAEHKKAIVEALSEQKIQLKDARKSLDEGNWQTGGIARSKKYFGNATDLEAARQEKMSQLDRMIVLNEKMSLDPFKYFEVPKSIDNPLNLNVTDLPLGAFVYPKDKNHIAKTGNGFFNKVYERTDGTYYNDGPKSKEEAAARIITHEISHFEDQYKAKGFNGKTYGSDDRFAFKDQFGI